MFRKFSALFNDSKVKRDIQLLDSEERQVYSGCRIKSQNKYLDGIGLGKSYLKIYEHNSHVSSEDRKRLYLKSPQFRKTIKNKIHFRYLDFTLFSPDNIEYYHTNIKPILDVSTIDRELEKFGNRLPKISGKIIDEFGSDERDNIRIKFLGCEQARLLRCANSDIANQYALWGMFGKAAEVEINHGSMDRAINFALKSKNIEMIDRLALKFFFEELYLRRIDSMFSNKKELADFYNSAKKIFSKKVFRQSSFYKKYTDLTT